MMIIGRNRRKAPSGKAPSFAKASEGKAVVPCPAAVERGERRAVMTIAVGSDFRWMFDVTIPTMRAYCERHGLELVVVDDAWRKNEHPCFMKQAINALWWKYDRVLYLDADILVSPWAPNLFDVVPPGMLAMYNEGTLYDRYAPRGQWMKDYLAMYNAKMVELGAPEDQVAFEKWDGRYWNAGVFLCDQATNPHRPPVHGVMRLPNSGHFDQHYVNTMIVKHAIPMYELSWTWNRLVTGDHVAGSSDMFEGTHFAHYASRGAKSRVLTDAARWRDWPRTMAGGARYGVNVVFREGKRKWILDKMVAAIVAGAPAHVQVKVSAGAVREPGWINYYVPYRWWVKGDAKKLTLGRKEGTDPSRGDALASVPSLLGTDPGAQSGDRPCSGTHEVSPALLDVVFCTHPEVEPLFWEAGLGADHAVVMCRQYRDALVARGAAADRVTLIYPGVDARYLRDRLRIFNPVDMSGRGARKGPALWDRLKEEPWLECVCSDGKLSEDQVEVEYRRCDAVVITSTMEGGPMALLEGVALGKTVVAPREVGFVDDYRWPGVWRYGVGNIVELLEVLAELRKHRYVREMTWGRWAEQHWGLFDRLMGVGGGEGSRVLGLGSREDGTNRMDANGHDEY